MLVLGIDPGQTSGWCRYDATARCVVDGGVFAGWNVFPECCAIGVDVVVMERPVAHGPTRPQVVECAYVAGRIFQRMLNWAGNGGERVVELTRLQVKQALTLATSNEVRVVNDATAWAALKLLHGENSDRKGGPLHGVRAHARAALAVAVAFAIRSETAGAALADRARPETIGHDRQERP